ncbi:YbgA family protein [Teredinibacter turnerae]|uniref:YbgA family protein n=1 Tax=Teredinibacter turnerae TaxID=2426 RepID=UPI00035DBF3B|nr:DUF523 and DUF1722 domain-containing protein [Teredinibacter turnerae]
MADEKIRIGISSCLLGEQVRFDGGHKHQKYITRELAKFFEFRSFCPEVAIGLGIPREPIRLVLDDDRDHPIRVVGTKDPSIDVTQDLIDCANAQQVWLKDLSGYIFKKDSPSCGMERVKAYRNSQPTRQGVGLFARTVMENNPLIPVEEEGRLNDEDLRENFIERVYVYHRWRALVAEGLTAKTLVEFHARHKFIAMAHNQKLYRELGRYIAAIPKKDLHSYAEGYIARLMFCLRKPATLKNHINVLQHIQGFLGDQIDAEDKQEMVQAIENCRVRKAPLTIPRTLLKHHFRKHPNEYIADSYYLAPFPEELAHR